MLRITVQDDERTAAFKLEGKLAHEWVAEAQKAWVEFSSLPRRERIIVDLCGVSFVDDAGRELLVRMHAFGAKLIGAGPMSSALIEEICRESQPSGRKWARGVLGLLFLLAAAALLGGDVARSLLPIGFAGRMICVFPVWLLSLHNYANEPWKGLFL